jgi:hypothetical protein
LARNSPVSKSGRRKRTQNIYIVDRHRIRRRISANGSNKMGLFLVVTSPSLSPGDFHVGKRRIS